MLCDEGGVRSRITVILMAEGPEPAYSVSAMHPAAENAEVPVLSLVRHDGMPALFILKSRNKHLNHHYVCQVLHMRAGRQSTREAQLCPQLIQPLRLSNGWQNQTNR